MSLIVTCTFSTFRAGMVFKIVLTKYELSIEANSSSDKGYWYVFNDIVSIID